MNKKRIAFIATVVAPIGFGILLYTINTTGIVRNYVPDFLWSFAATSTLLFIWGRLNKIWLFVLASFCTVFEIAQSIGIIKGTGDVWDIVAYAAGIIFSLLNFKYHEKKQTSTISIGA